MADVYTSGSGNWISPGNGVVLAKGNGGGGGGGGGNNAGGGTAGSGGGGGGYFEVEIPVTTGQSLAYVVGPGGAGGTEGNPGTNGTAGGATTIDGGTYTANGGAAGQTASTGTPAGGTASGGDTNITGSSGGGAVGNVGGTGGASPNGGALVAGTIPNAGSVATGNAPGGGGPGGAGGVNGTDGGAGANGQVSFDFTADPSSAAILRPIAGLEEDIGTPTWAYIDEVVTQPTSPGDGVFAEFVATGDVYYDAKYQVEAPDAGTLILGAKLWVLAHTEDAGTVRIEQVRIKISGTWYDLGIVDDYLTESPVWYSYPLVGIAESSDSTDIGFEVKIHDENWAGDKALIDVAYLEVSYPPTDHSGYGSVSGTDEFYGAGGRTFEGYGSLSGAGEFSGTGTQPARGYGWVIGTDDFSGVGRVPDSGYGPVTGTGYFYGVGRLPDSGYGSVSGAGVLSGTGSVPASSAVVRLRRAGIMGEW